MRVVFAGTPDFAVPCLAALLNSEHHVVAVYTQPDRPAGRGQKLTPSPVKQLALEHQIPVFQPLSLRTIEAQEELINLQPDVMIVVAYGLLLPAEVLAIPRYGCINVHASLLPRWRGAAPIQRAIAAGDKVTGITIMQMETGLDTGPMLKHVTCPIESTDTSASLHQQLALLGSTSLITTLEDLTSDNLKPELQDSAQACYAKKIEKSEAEINWSLSTAELDRLIRAFNPWPVAYTAAHDQTLRIWQATPLLQKHQLTPGTISQANEQGIDIATSDGLLRITHLQLPGARCLPVAEVLHAKSAWFTPGTLLGKSGL